MELFERKMEIAEQAGKLQEEIKKLSDIAKDIRKCKEHGHSLTVAVSAYSRHEIESWLVNPNGTALHNCLLQFLDGQIEKRKHKLNELIKITQ